MDPDLSFGGDRSIIESRPEMGRRIMILSSFVLTRSHSHYLLLSIER